MAEDRCPTCGNTGLVRAPNSAAYPVAFGGSYGPCPDPFHLEPDTSLVSTCHGEPRADAST